MWRAPIPLSERASAFFGDIRPAKTMVEVSKLISPEMLVEIRADAVVEP